MHFTKRKKIQLTNANFVFSFFVSDLARRVRRHRGMEFELPINLVRCVRSDCQTFKMKRERWKRCQKDGWNT